MKEPIDHTENATVPEYQQCSEKKCVTCFENRGCIYEQYLIASTHNIVETHPGSRLNTGTQQWGKHA
jgi:hypothetical protein